MSRAPSDQPPAGDADLARAWREASHDEPPAALDDAIRAAARQAVHAGPRRVAESPFGGRWRVPLSVAAVLVVSATVTLLVAERERHGSRSVHEQDAPPAARAPQAHTGEPAAGSSETPARQFAEPPPFAQVAPRERELARTVRPAQEERKALPSATPPPSSAEKLQARTQPTQEEAAQQSAQESAAVEADQRADRRSENQQVGAAPGGPVPAAVPPVQQADTALRDAARPGDEPIADLSKREKQTAQDEPQAAGQAPAASARMQLAPREAPAPKADMRAAPAAPRAKAAAEASASADTAGLEPKAWLDRILELRRQGKLEEADKSLKAFRERYPAYPLPPELKGSP